MKLASCLTLLSLLVTSPAGAAASPSSSAPPARWTWHVYGSASVIDVAGEVYQARLGATRHWSRGLSIEMSGMVAWFDAEPIREEAHDDGSGAGFDLLLRWHFQRRANWAAFLDVGAGALWFENEFPTHNGTSFNFEPMAGIGFTHRIRGDLHLLWGARWHHISNGDIFGKEENRGYDAVMPYVGVTWGR